MLGHATFVSLPITSLGIVRESVSRQENSSSGAMTEHQ
jgi:hypothetical protein